MTAQRVAGVQAHLCERKAAWAMKAMQRSRHSQDLGSSSALRVVMPRELRAIVCFVFDRHAEPSEVHSFKAELLERPLILHAVEASGAYDFMIEAAVPDMSAYRDILESLAQSIAKLVVRYEESFICKRFVRMREEDPAIWVPAPNGIKRVDSRLIDKITAEGDYMRVHSRGNSWLLHATMRSLAHRLDQRNFLRVHRSAIVSLNFIDCLVHEGRQWIVQLHDGTRERIARRHVSKTLGLLRSRLATA